MGKTIHAADLFAGAGGTSTGLLQAAEAQGLRVNLTAVNHWETAVETHSRNHPGATHLCQPIDSIDPRKAVPGGKLDLLVASPECIHHSRARGGKPMSDQSRSTAWNILNWCDALEVQSVLIENVPEFADWGPLYAEDYKEEKLRHRPVPEQKGKFFKNFLRNLRCLGYQVDYRVLTCADYGDATTRKRLFIRAEKGRRPKWPTISHYPSDALSLTGKHWVPARDIIDWNLPGTSIFHRKRPLAPATLRRIEAGLRKFCGFPHLTVFRNNCDAVSLDKPLPAVCTSAGHFGVCSPFLIGAGGPQGAGHPRSADAPLGTVLPGGHRAVVQPFLVEYHGGKERVRTLGQPLPTQDTSNRFAVALPYLVKYYEGSDAASIEKPLPSVTANYEHLGLASPFLVSYYGNGDAHSVSDPLDTVTTKDRFGLAQPVLKGEDGQLYLLDILFRMLQPSELAAAHSFPKGYSFAGKRDDIVRQIGNSVPVQTAAALCSMAFAEAA